jgi:hypothetical protein
MISWDIVSATKARFRKEFDRQSFQFTVSMVPTSTESFVVLSVSVLAVKFMVDNCTAAPLHIFRRLNIDQGSIFIRVSSR